MAGPITAFFAILAAASAPPAPASAAAASGAPVAAAPLPAGASFVREQDYRVARIGYRIGLSGAAHCPDPYPLTGLLLHHLAEYSQSDRPAAAEHYSLDRGPAILAVVEESPAARAGLAAGDVVLAVNGRSLPSPVAMAQGRDNEEARPAIEATEAQLEAELRRGPADLRLLRNGEELTLRLDPVDGCPARVRLARSSQVNAFAHNGYAIMTTALLAFLESDDELAVVLGHEIAHNILRHPAMLDAQGVPDGILRGFGRNASRVRATEEAADRLGIRLAWAAGYDVSAAIPYWRRYYAKYDTMPQLFRTHPSLRARERLIVEVLTKLGSSGSDLGSKRPELGEGALRKR